MASSNGTKKYPLRLYEEGKAHLQRKSTNHNCHLANFGMVKNGLGLDVWDYLKNSAVGVIIKLYERNMIWCSATVHYFLTRQLSITRSHEIWTLISGRPIRLSLHEFSEITGLNCDPSNIEDKCDVTHKDFWKDMEVSTSVGPSLDELVLVLKRCQTWSFEQRRMVGWLFILSIGIYGISHSSRIPLRYAKMVLNPEFFEKYPWGRVAFNSLIESIKIICYEAKKTYTVHGCVYALQVWAYESVPVLGEFYGRRLEGMEVPLLSWDGSRHRVNLDDILAEEKSIHGKLRVRHLIVKPEEEIYHPWGKEDETDTELDNMIHDILHDHLDESFWNSVGAKANKLKKQKQLLHEVEMSRKKRKKDVNDSCALTETSKDARENNGNRERELQVHGLDGLVQKVEFLTEKIAEMDSNIANKVATCLEVVIDARLDAKLNDRLVPMVKKLDMLEKDVEQLKQGTQACQPKEIANSNEEDEAVSKTPVRSLRSSRKRKKKLMS